MLVTRQNRIPFIWVAMAMLPWAFWYFQMLVSGVNFFILNRLIDNPATLTFVLGLPGLIFTLLPLGSYISFKSDRIWTRWGRRKIFIIVAFGGWTLAFIGYPLAPNIWVFVSIMFVISFFGCFAAPLETLKLEIIPPYLRGRSAAMFTWITTSINIVFYAVVLGRIDEVMPFLGFHLGGDKIVFWSAAGCVLTAMLIYIFGVHEINPKSAITGEKFRLGTVWKALTMPQLRYLYVFMFAVTMLTAGLGPLGQLLYLNQWGYSVQEFGFNVAVGGVINLFLIPIVGIFADMGKKNRMAIYLSCLSMVLLLNVTYFCYVTFYLPDQRPSLVEIIFFGETTCVFGIIAGMVYYPLVYDYIPRNIMGTYVAGTSILSAIFSFTMLQGLGWFMWLWASIFQPPAGEMARVCLDKEMPQREVQQILRNAGLTTAAGAKAAPSDISVKPWFANGMVQNQGICYEVRLRDKDAETKFKRRDAVKTEADLLEAKLKNEQEHGATSAAIEKRTKEIAADKAENESLTAELDKRAASWQDQVVAGLGSDLMTSGTEVLKTTPAQAVVTVLPTLRKASDTELDKLNRLYREGDPNAIGLRVKLNPDRTFALSVSARLDAGKDAGAIAKEACKQVSDLAAKAAPKLVADNAQPAQPEVRAAETVDVALVENPVRTFVSPISRVVNFVISQFTEVPPPDLKLHSLARDLCKADQIAHARVDTLPDRNGVRVLAVASTATLDDPAAWQAKLIAGVSKEGASLKLTALTPMVDKGIAPLRYNYMVGYLYVFFQVAIGFMLVMYFIRMEKKGKVRKLGAMEAEENAAQHKAREEAAQAEAAVSLAAGTAPQASTAETYTPGYLMPKVLLVVAGLLLTTVSAREAWPGLRLLFAGERAEGVAVSVIGQKAGLENVILNTQAELTAKLDQVTANKDYAWTFYNQFAFETRDGKQVTFRRDVGCKLRPPMPLLDDNGLPTAATLRYDPAKPTEAILPHEYSTWFAPVLTGILGIMATLTGLILAWYARKPIVLHSSASASVEAVVASSGH